MSFKLHFEDAKRGVKTKVVDLADDDGSPVYLLSPGTEKTRIGARDKWHRFEQWVTKSYAQHAPELVRGWLPPAPDAPKKSKWRWFWRLATIVAAVGLGYYLRGVIG